MGPAYPPVLKRSSPCSFSRELKSNTLLIDQKVRDLLFL